MDNCLISFFQHFFWRSEFHMNYYSGEQLHVACLETSMYGKHRNRLLAKIGGFLEAWSLNFLDCTHCFILSHNQITEDKYYFLRTGHKDLINGKFQENIFKMFMVWLSQLKHVMPNTDANNLNVHIICRRLYSSILIIQLRSTNCVKVFSFSLTNYLCLYPLIIKRAL